MPTIAHPPNNNQIRIINLYRDIKENKYCLNAEYQRQECWDVKKQSYLIDTIMNNLFIPHVLINKRYDKNEELIDVVMDGKQRLTSIVRFMDNEIPYITKVNDIRRYYYYNNIPEKCHTPAYILSNKDRNLFDSYHIAIVEYRYLNIEQEHEIFNRIQNGSPLNVAEKTKALPDNPMKKFVMELRAKFKNTIGAVIPADRDKDIIEFGMCVYISYHKITCLPSLSSEKIKKFVANATINSARNDEILLKMQVFEKFILNNSLRFKNKLTRAAFILYYAVIWYQGVENIERNYNKVVAAINNAGFQLKRVDKNNGQIMLQEIDAMKFY